MKILKSIRTIILTLCVVVAAACTNTSCDEKPKVQSASLRFDWFTSMSFAGEVVGLKDFAQKNGLTLKLEPGSESTDPIKLVISGSNEFGCVSVDKFLVANEKGADLVAIGVINQLSPTVFVSKKEKNINTPKDWVGKRVGLLPGGSTEYIYRSLLKKEGITSNQFKEITVPFDLSTFIADSYDVRPAFIYDEPIALETQNIPYTLIEPKDYGVTYVGRVYFARRDFVNNNPQIVESFLRTMADGWTAAVQNPDAAIEKLKEYEPKTDVSRDLKSLIKAKPYFVDSANKVLTFDYPKWDATVEELVGLGILTTRDYKKSVDDSFITKYYSSGK
mgnify:CR=1 FL=1